MFHVGCTPASVASNMSIFFLADTKRTKGRMWLCSKNFDVQRNWEKDTAVHSGHLRFMTSPEKSSDTTKEHLRSHIFKQVMQHFKSGKRNKDGMLPHLSILKRMVFCRYWAAIVGACAAGNEVENSGDWLCNLEKRTGLSLALPTNCLGTIFFSYSNQICYRLT